MAQIAILGLGYVGLTSAVGLAKLGHRVIGIDVDHNKADSLNAGRIPIQKPDISLAREKLNWEPTITIEEGVRRTALWMQDLKEAI